MRERVQNGTGAALITTLAAATMAMGCNATTEHTGLVVEVRAVGLVAGTDLDQVVATMGSARATFPLAAAVAGDKVTFPFRFGVAPQNSSSDTVTITVVGQLMGADKVQTSSQVGFVKNETHLLILTLYGSCVDRSPACAAGTRCVGDAADATDATTKSRCLPNKDDASKLPLFTGGSDGGVADIGGSDAPRIDAPGADGAGGADSADASQAADGGEEKDDALPPDGPTPDGPGPTMKTIGDSCTTASECASGFCADKVCCNEACAGQCAACDGATKGTCLVVIGAPHGARAACTGAGACAGSCDGKDVTACHYPGASVMCAAGSCTAGVATPEATCDGKGACGTPAPVTCAPAPCDGKTCGQCSATNPCASGFQCDTGRCVAKLDPGQSCRAADQCKSGFCQQDVCCDRACTGACEACDQSGHAGTCTFLSGNVCRASAGACDQAETCNGSASGCPADGKKVGGTECRAAAGACDVAETCDGSNVGCPADGKKAGGTECRAAAGACDIAETCDGSSIGCPADGKKPGGTECRAASGACDVAETCNGSSAGCPVDGRKPAGTECRGAAGACDVAEACDGSAADCPGDAKKPVGTECRAAAGACDVAETCDGFAVNCPADVKRQNGFTCRAAAGTCDVAETCDGASPTCPADARKGSSVVCRAAVGACDAAENCDGVVLDCPADKLKGSGVKCGDAAGVCGSLPRCDGQNTTCPDSTPTSGGVCRASNGLSDPSEACNGSSFSCPSDVKHTNRIINPQFDQAMDSWQSPNANFSIDTGGVISGPNAAKLHCPKQDFIQLNQTGIYVFQNFNYHLAFQAKATTPVMITVGINGVYSTVEIGTTVQQFGPFDFPSGASNLVDLQFQSLEEQSPFDFTIWIDRVEVYTEGD